MLAQLPWLCRLCPCIFVEQKESALDFNSKYLMQDCNLVLYTNGRAAIFSTATYNQDTPPCSAVVSSSAGGTLSVLDSTGRVLYKAPGAAAG